MSHALSPVRYRENIAKFGPHIGASSKSGFTILYNSVEGLALSYVDDKGVAYQDKKEHTCSN